MRSLITTGIAAASLMLAAGCASPGGGFTSNMAQPLRSSIGGIEVSVADDIISRQSPSRRISGNNTIGPEDAEDVSELLYAELEQALRASGAYRPEVGEPVAVLKATITQVTPNRLEFTERGRKDPTFSQGVARGGATVEAVLIAPDGSEIGTFSYKRYAASLDDAAARAGTWHDAKRTFSVFADEIAKTVSSSPPSF